LWNDFLIKWRDDECLCWKLTLNLIFH
jgi:hypothetical protein